MTTQINVTVGGVELPAQARRGQEGNRWRLEQTEQQRQTTAQQQAAQAQQAAKAVTGTPSGRAPGYGYRPDELAASRRGGKAYIIIININAARDDAFDLYVSVPSGSQPIKQPGSADFTFSGEITAYLWTQSRMSADTFLSTKAGSAIQTQMDTEWGLGLPLMIRDTQKLTNVRPRTESTFSLRMVVTKANNNGNFGVIVTGFTDSEDYNETWYEDGDLNVGDEVKTQLRYPWITGWGGVYTPTP